MPDPERVEVRPEITPPWEQEEIKAEQKVEKEVRREMAVSDETKKTCEEVLQAEADQIRLAFAQQWFEEHREELEKKGIVPADQDITPEKQREVALGLALKELRENEVYQAEHQGPGKRLYSGCRPKRQPGRFTPGNATPAAEPFGKGFGCPGPGDPGNGTAGEAGRGN